jgi:hypothetical protein
VLISHCSSHGGLGKTQRATNRNSSRIESRAHLVAKQRDLGDFGIVAQAKGAMSPSGPLRPYLWGCDSVTFGGEADIARTLEIGRLLPIADNPV